MAEQNSRPVDTEPRIGCPVRWSGTNQSQPLPPISAAIQDGDVVFDRDVVPIGTASAGWSLARLCYYRTNYGKITSISDRLFQLTKSGQIFAAFDIFRWRY
jgi:hypothetical protein